VILTPALSGWRMPAEWERHSRCWMAWPCDAGSWHKGLDEIRTAYAEVARAIAVREPVTVLCNPEDAVDVSLACGGGIQVLPLEIGDRWLRNTGPLFLLDDYGGVSGVQRFENTPSSSHLLIDTTLARRVLSHLGLPCFDGPQALEGGAIATDGAGTVLATEQFFLNPDRSPHANRDDVEALLKAYTGARTIIWLGQGYQDDRAGGHVDEVARFVRPGVVVALTTPDSHDGNFAALHDNQERLKKARDALGRSLEIIPIRQPARRDHGGRRMTLSYTSFYIGNGQVIMPGFEDSADQGAYRTLRRAFLNREIVQIPALDIVAGGGGSIHRMTLEQPAPVPIPYDPVI